MRPVGLGDPKRNVVALRRPRRQIRVGARVRDRDELSADARFVANEDGLFDANDQAVFMARDLGDAAPETSSISGIEANATVYQVTATDPLNPARRGQVYLVRSPALRSAPTADYVGFDPALHRIDGGAYHLGFATPNAWADYLSLGSGGADILDRTKLFADCNVPLVCPVNEEDQANLQDNLIKDGTVRVILRNGHMLAYGTMLQSTTALTIPSTISVSQARFSIDFSPAVSGATLYSQAAPGGVAVDGVPDTIAPTPVSGW